MKYQIYLNQKTTDYVNKIAEHENKKPATAIKQILESMFNIAEATANQLEKELKK